MSALAQAVKLLLVAGIFFTVFALALRARAVDVLHLVREWKLGLRALAAMYVVVPAIALLITASFDLKPPVKIALVALAFSPVPPLLPGKQMKAGGSASYVTSLLVLAALLSLLIAPLGIHLVGNFASRDVQVSMAALVRTLAISIAAPLAAGLLVGSVLGTRADKVAAIIGKAANALFMVSVLALLIAMLPAVAQVIGDGTILAFVALIISGVAAGYFLGGPVAQDRSALALAAASRHPGIAAGIAAASFPDERLAPAAIILYALLAALISTPFLRRLSRRESAAP